tara:strand:- start:764 stop:1096 length:333 start_codon:yes stop_codon:yes gene_type:complete
MRKVTEQIKTAFENGESLKVGNTRTDGMSVFLHGNEIIRRDISGLVFATLAGYNTRTTMERVNGIAGMNFHQLGFVACLDGEPVCEDDWFVQTHDGTATALSPTPKAITI